MFQILDQFNTQERDVISMTKKIHVARLRPSGGGKLQCADRDRRMSFRPCSIIHDGNAGRFGNSHRDRNAVNAVLNRAAKRSPAQNLNGCPGNESHFHEARSNSARPGNCRNNRSCTKSQISQSHCIHKTTASSKTGETGPQTDHCTQTQIIDGTPKACRK